MNIFDESKAGDPAAMFQSCSRAVVGSTRELLELEAEGKVSGRTRLRLAWTVADYEDAARELSFEELPSGVKDDLWMAGRFASTIGKASRKSPAERDVNAERLGSAADSLEQSAASIIQQIEDEARLLRKGSRSRDAAPDESGADPGNGDWRRPRRRFFSRKN